MTRYVRISLVLLTLALGCSESSDPVEPPGESSPSWSVVGASIQGGAILSVWGASDGPVWAVGGEQLRPLALRFEDGGWTRDEPPTTAQLWWVHGAGSTVVTVGANGTAWQKRAGEWAEISGAPAGTTLYGVWLASDTLGWAVGGPSDAPPEGVEPTGDVLLRWDGTEFVREMPDVLLDRPGQQRLFKVWGSGPNDVFVVGSEGLVIHFDGSEWARMDSGTTEMLFTVSGRGPDDVYAVGGGARAVLIHYDGSRWEELELPDLAPQILQGVWAAPGQPLWISGFFGFTARRAFGEDTWDTLDVETVDALHSVFQDSTGRVWAGGGDIAVAKPDYTGVLLVSESGLPLVPGTDPAPEPVDPDPVVCDAVIEGCPDELPHEGMACAGTLDCDYPVLGDVANTVHTATCENEVIQIASQCEQLLGGGCAVPPLAEACLDPSTEAIAGADVNLGVREDGTFRAWSEGEAVRVVWGGQGSPMLPLFLEVTGADQLSCGSVRTEIAIDGEAEVDATQPVVFRCGSTLRVFVVLPFSPMECIDKVFELDVSVTVDGVGSAAQRVTLESCL